MSRLGFTRARGDGSINAGLARYFDTGFHPRTRGWIGASGKRDLSWSGVSPAHAGMDRRSSLKWGYSERVSPAHAGMDRVGVVVREPRLRVSPAHAGMDRIWKSESDAGDPRFTRARGDGSEVAPRYRLSYARFHPRTRGWIATPKNPRAGRLPFHPRTRGWIGGR